MEQGPRKTCDSVNGLHRLCVIAIPRFYIDYAGAGRGGDYAGTAADVAKLLNEERDASDGIVLDRAVMVAARCSKRRDSRACSSISVRSCR